MKIKEDLMLRNIAGEWILVPMGERLLEFNGLIKVNKSGSFILNLIENEKTKKEIIEAVLEQYEVDEETAIREVDTFLQTLVDAHILEA
jgi:methyltransferase-like protein